jgi:hypothetical protein
MTRLLRACAMTLPLVALCAAPAFADVKTRNRTQIHFEGMLGHMVGMFGGKAAKEGVETTTAVKGDRKATTTDTTERIVDLSEEKIYEIDRNKKTYVVMTFAEMRRRMEEAREKAKENMAKQQQTEKPQTEKPQEKPTKEIDVDFDVKETGQKKQLVGYEAHESVMTITVREKGKTLEEAGGIVMTTNLWLAPEIPQMKELADFEIRYWKQLQGPDAMAVSADQMAAVMAMYPMVKDAMERMQKEGPKLQGTPLETITTFEAVKSKDQLTQEQSNNNSSSSGGLSGMLARKMMKKEDPKERATIFTAHNEVLEISTSVAAADLAIPADYKEKK